MNIKIKRLYPDAILPQYHTSGAVGMDLHSYHDRVLLPWNVQKLITGVAFEIPEGFEGQVRPRSGFGYRGIIMPNAPGTIDSDYRGDVGVLLLNTTSTMFSIKKGDRIAQLVIAPVVRATLYVVDELDETERGAGGYGSTGR